MYDLQIFSDEAFIIVDCAPSIIDGSLTIILDRPMSYIYPGQYAYVYAKELHYRVMLVSIAAITPQVCKIDWEKTYKPLGAVIYPYGAHGSIAAEAAMLQFSLQIGMYDGYIASICKAFGTDFADTSLERE